MPEPLAFRDSQNPWLTAGGGGAAPPAPPGGELPPGAWQGFGPGISNVRDGGDLSKWINVNNYQNWDRDTWRAVMNFGSHNQGGLMSELENLIGTHALNQHKNYFAAGGQGYLPGHFDYNTGKMVYNGIDPDLVKEVNNRNFTFSHGSTSGAPVSSTGALGTHMQSGIPQVSSNSMSLPKNPVTPSLAPTGYTGYSHNPANQGSSAPATYSPTGLGNSSTTSAPGVQATSGPKNFGTGSSWSENKSPWATGQNAPGSTNPWKRWGMQ